MQVFSLQVGGFGFTLVLTEMLTLLLGKCFAYGLVGLVLP